MGHDAIDAAQVAQVLVIDVEVAEQDDVVFAARRRGAPPDRPVRAR